MRQDREQLAKVAQQTAVTQQAAQMTSRDYSVEEAFAQFSVLQTVKSRLQQFGYDFFDTQATSFAPVLDAPVGPAMSSDHWIHSPFISGMSPNRA